MFRKLHNSYTDVMCNPFYNPGDRIQSRWAMFSSFSLYKACLAEKACFESQGAVSPVPPGVDLKHP